MKCILINIIKLKKYIKYYNDERICHTLKGKTSIEYWNFALEKYI
ncbi:MAG: IS3 family transposase [Lactobacillus sp.]|nr:IS3 family transposase [Lactobacillus sp.]